MGEPKAWTSPAASFERRAPGAFMEKGERAEGGMTLTEVGVSTEEGGVEHAGERPVLLWVDIGEATADGDAGVLLTLPSVGEAESGTEAALLGGVHGETDTEWHRRGSVELSIVFRVILGVSIRVWVGEAVVEGGTERVTVVVSEPPQGMQRTQRTHSGALEDSPASARSGSPKAVQLANRVMARKAMSSQKRSWAEGRQRSGVASLLAPPALNTTGKGYFSSSAGRLCFPTRSASLKGSSLRSTNITP